MRRRAFLSAISVGISGCVAPSAPSQQSLTSRVWNRDANNPLITGNEQTKHQAGFGGVVHARTVLSNPIDSWYFFWAGHDGGGIWLSTAPSLTGPWTAHDQLFTAADVGGGDHVSSPYPVVHNGRIRLYYHRQKQKHNKPCQETELVELDPETGQTPVTDPLVVLPAHLDGSWQGVERTYFKVLKRDGRYLGVYQGRDREKTTPGIGFGTSTDGIEWDMSPHPAFYNSFVQDDSGFIGGPHLMPFDDQLHLLYQDRARPDGSSEGIYVLPWGDRDEQVVEGELVLAAKQSWTNGESLHVVDHAFNESLLYLFYADSTFGGTQNIGVATLEM